MTAVGEVYGKAVFSMNIENHLLESAISIIQETPLLYQTLVNPTISQKEKNRIIDAVFDGKCKSFLKVMCLHNHLDQLQPAYEAYRKLSLEKDQAIEGKLIYTIEPSESQLNKIKDFVKQKYHKKNVLLQMQKDPSILGGCILTVGNTEYDKSIKMALQKLKKSLKKR